MFFQLRNFNFIYLLLLLAFAPRIEAAINLSRSESASSRELGDLSETSSFFFGGSARRPVNCELLNRHTYTPVRSLANRENTPARDLVGKASGCLSEAPEVIELGWAQIELPAAIARLLEEARAALLPSPESVGKISDLLSPEHERFAPCDEWKKLRETLPQAQAECPALRGLNFSLLNQGSFYELCLELLAPERLLLQHPRGRVDPDTILDPRGWMLTAGHAFLEQNIHDWKWAERSGRELSQIIGKARRGEFAARIYPQINELSPVDSTIANSRCVSNMSNEFRERAQAGLNNLRLQQERMGPLTANAPAFHLEELNKSEREALAITMGALYWRLRGGGILDEPPGTQASRRWFAGNGFETLARVLGAERFLAESLGDDQVRRLQMRGWGEYMDIGHTPGGASRESDLIHMTERGQYQSEGLAQLLQRRSLPQDLAQAAGGSLGPCYAYAWTHLSSQRISSAPPLPWAAFIDGPTAWGELCFGANLGLAMVDIF